MSYIGVKLEIEVLTISDCVYDLCMNIQALTKHMHREECAFVLNVPAVCNAWRMLKDEFGLNVYKKAIVNKILDSNRPFYGFNFEARREMIVSYDFIEEGTENDKHKNNIATWSQLTDTLLIHYHPDRTWYQQGSAIIWSNNPEGKILGRPHGLVVQEWYDVGY